MLEHFFDNPVVVERLRSNPLSPHLDSFAASLAALGYARFTGRAQIDLLARMGRWLAGSEFTVADLDEQIVSRFFDEVRCQGHQRRGDRGTGCRFLEHLRRGGVIPMPEGVSDQQPLALIEGRYAHYLKVERGLSTDTVHNYVPFIHRFLVERFGDEALQPGALKASDASAFILRHARSLSPGRAKLMVTVLRSFLRFLLQRGEIDTDLAAAVPAVAGWRQAAVPKYLGVQEVERVLDSCDRHTAAGRRNHAILLLLARLGLRAGEVVALELDDVDWRGGEIRVRGKGRLHDRLPLFTDVGEALATYLRQDRPRCASRRVFIRIRAPHRGFLSPAAVSTIVERSVDRAGLHRSLRGAHLLRHSLATGMLRGGASMAEVGQVLRHRSPTTTEIYAKVDFEGLRGLAQPWPGGGCSDERAA
jgi:site-specific recombinase XerD